MRGAFVDPGSDLPKLKARSTESTVPDAPFLATVVSRQHPDHDTAEWPPES